MPNLPVDVDSVSYTHLDVYKRQFLLTQFMRGIPPEVIEAARVESANGRQIFFRIVLPLRCV